MIKDNNAKVAFISEVDGDENLVDVNIPGYETIIAQPKESGKVRIMAFVNKNIKYKVRLDLMSKELSTIWIEIIRAEQKSILCCGIYREWTGEQAEELEKLCSQVKIAVKEKKSLVLIGDINLDADKWDDTNYKNKGLADIWKREIAWRGLEQYQLGPTFLSYYTTNGGKKVESALETYTQTTKEHSTRSTSCQTMACQIMSQSCAIWN